MMKVCVYAFANTALFFERLIEHSRAQQDGIAWSAIVPRWQQRQRMQAVLSASALLYLYQDFDARYQRGPGDAQVLGQGLADAGDNELLCLLKDKGGYRTLDGVEQLRRAETVAAIYREFLERERPDYLIFPDVEVVDGFILLSLCRRLGITPLYYVGMRFLGGGFFSSDCYDTLPPYFGAYDEAGLQRARDFLNGFLDGAPQPLHPASTDRSALARPAPLWQRLPLAAWNHWRFERRYVGEDRWLMRIKMNIGRPLHAYRAWYFRTIQSRYFDLVSDSHALPARYVLYTLQYTPESSINGLEPYYVDQTRAIDLLLMGMPSGCRLVVKEHPAIAGVRANAFYRELRRKPGVVMAAPALSTRRLMQGAVAVASVTGTIGLECYLLGIPCLLFGRNFFSHLCAFGEGPSSIRQTLSRLVEGFVPPSFEDRARELARLLAISYPIELSDPLVRPEVVGASNIQAFLGALHQHIARLRAAAMSASTELT
jgi:hypothetical protein